MFTKKFNDQKTNKEEPPTPPPHINLCKLIYFNIIAIANRESPMKFENKDVVKRLGTIMHKFNARDSAMGSISMSSRNSVSDSSFSNTEENKELDVTQKPPDSFIDLFEQSRAKRNKRLRMMSSDKTPKISTKKRKLEVDNGSFKNRPKTLDKPQD